jgi:hypothetical protein
MLLNIKFVVFGHTTSSKSVVHQPRKLCKFRVRYRYLTNWMEQASDTYNLTSGGSRTTKFFCKLNHYA